MSRSHTDKESGITITVYAGGYTDWGITITDKDGTELFDGPCHLSNESYGHKPNPDKYEMWEDAEQAALDGDDEAVVPWDDSDWRECLADEFDELIDAFIGWDRYDEATQTFKEVV